MWALPAQLQRASALQNNIGLEDVMFKVEAYLDVMYLDSRPVLYTVDVATRFSATRFLQKVGTEAVWESIIMCRSSAYTDLPHGMSVDEGS